MPLIRNTGSLAIRCFKTVETCADRLTGAAGPVFVTICWFLITSGGFAFLDVILYHKPWTIPRILFLPLAILIMANLYAQYYYATTTPPGNPHSILDEIKNEASWMLETARQRIDPAGSGQGNRSDPGKVGADGTWAGGRLRKCGRCFGPKPIRTHHCKVCRSCVMMMDHHCPWINQCVGINNQRHFVLFMGWLSISCWTNAILGWSDFWLSMSYRPNWTSWTPPILFTLIWVLSVALGVAVPMLLFWHLHLITRGETSIEGHDNDYFSKKAKERGVVYVNPYDLGNRRRNIEWYFNVGEGRLPHHTLLTPYRYPPASTGWRFPLHPVALSRKRQAEDDDMPEQQNRDVVVGDEDEGELTDDEAGGGGFWQDQTGDEDVRWR